MKHILLLLLMPLLAYGQSGDWHTLQYGTSSLYMALSDTLITTHKEAAVDSAYYWRVEGDSLTGYTLYNMKGGPARPLTLPSRTHKDPARLGGAGESRFHMADNGKGKVFFLTGDTCAVGLYGNKLVAYKTSTISRTYCTNAATRALLTYVGEPPFVPVEALYVYCAEGETLLQGDKGTIYVSPYPYNTTDTQIRATSSDDAVIHITKLDGVVIDFEAAGPGTATVIIVSTANPRVRQTMRFTVRPNIKVERIAIEPDTIYMPQGTQHAVDVQVIPADAINGDIRWTNSKPAVATITHDGLVYALTPGTTVLTAHSTDGTNRLARLTVIVKAPTAEPDALDNDGRYHYALRADSSLLAVPTQYIESQAVHGTTLNLTLTGLGQYVITDVAEWADRCPVDLPAFKSYKFNNKYNDQLFADIIAPDPAADTLRLTAPCIGKSLTASFQLPDSTLEVYIHTARQRSKVTRQRFDRPLTYTIARPDWRELELQRQPDSTLLAAEIPYGRRTTVSVAFPTDTAAVPRIDIRLTPDSTAWNSTTYISSKEEYRDALITIQGGGAFPDMPTTPILIKGRGNSSWTHSVSAKNPYHFKFDVKQKPLGMKAGKHWLLIANRQDGSMMANAIAQRAAQMFGVEYPCHVLPCELYINGSYRGSYCLTERIGLSNNSVDLLDDSQAAIIELDTYTDESIFQTPYYAYTLPVKLKDAYAENDTVHMDAYNAFLPLARALADGRPYDDLIDIDATAAYLLTNEYIANCELKHPKSVFLWNENIYTPDAWHFGPVWDCDWAFGYQQGHTYYINAADFDFYADMGYGDGYYGNTPQQFWHALRYGSPALDRATYSRLYHFITGGGLQELQEYVQDYYDFAAPSFTHNRLNATDSRDATSYATQVRTAQKWLAERAATLFQQADSYDLSDEPNADLNPTDDIRQPALTPSTALYDLQGRRLTHRPQRGLYIQNGRKVLIR